MNGNNPLWSVIGREFRRIRDRKTLWMLMISVPILVFAIIALIYSKGVVTNMPLAVSDHDHSALSRTIIRSLQANRTFQIVTYVNSTKDIERAFKQGKIQAAIYIPKGTEKTIKSGKSAHLVFYKNSSNIIIGNIAIKAALTTLRTISTGLEIRKLEMQGNMPPQALSKAHAIEVHTNSLFNPAYNYENYLVGGLLPILYQMVVMITAVLVISAEIKEGTIRELFQLAHENIFILLAGKSIPHLLLHLSGILFLVGIIFPLFHLPVHASVWLLIAYLFYFVTVAFFLGLFLSCLFKDMMLATEAAIFISTPAFIFTGYTFPLKAMPLAHTIYAQLLPSTHFMIGYIKLYQMGLPFSFVLPEVFKLTIFLVISVAGTLGLMSWRKKQLSVQSHIAKEALS